MASVSGTSSIGNTSLRGYGGFATGLDRDALIEQMTKGTTTKINNHKNSMTSAKWKQEAFQSISDKLIDMEDKYFSYASTTNLKDASLFAKNMVTAIGKEDVTRFVSASGTSNMLEYLAIDSVRQLATSATVVSTPRTDTGITTEITTGNWDSEIKISNLKGKFLDFGVHESNNSFKRVAKFTFPTTYKDGTKNADGSDHIEDIDYTEEPEELVKKLNMALEQSNFKLDDNVTIKFEYDGTSISIKGVKPSNRDEDADATALDTYLINDTSTALDGLGLKKADITQEMTIKDVNDKLKVGNFKSAYINTPKMIEYLKDSDDEDNILTITYGGQTKKVRLIESADQVDSFDSLIAAIQKNINTAFGENKISVDNKNGKLTFTSITQKIVSGEEVTPELKITSDNAELRKRFGIVKNASTKLSMNGTMIDNGFFSKDDLSNGKVIKIKINEVEFEIDKNTTLNNLIDKINNNKDVGVKASFLSNSNQLVLIASQTGSGRKIKLDGNAETIFGGTPKDGQDAVMKVSYGNGITDTFTSSTNTFDLEGMKVTVSGVFGGEWTKQDKKDSAGNITQEDVWVPDTSESVTFSAKADAEGVTEKIKKFVEEYNAMITEINSQVTTRPNSTYGPLTDAQKADMDEKSIENWETQAKAGILFNDGTMRDLSMSMQNVLNELLSSGVKYKDLQEIGVSYSEDWGDGGTLVFDEAKFKSAMETDPEKVSNIFTGGGDVKKGLSKIMEDTMTTYATRFPGKNGNSYGRLIEEAGSEKIPSSISHNEIYRRLQDMQKQLETLQQRLATEQDRYISQFTTMETMISKMNAQSSWLSQG